MMVSLVRFGLNFRNHETQVSHIIREPERWSLLAEASFQETSSLLFELNFLNIRLQTAWTSGHLVETPGWDRVPHSPRGRVRDGQGAGDLLVQGVPGHRRGRRRAEPHRGGRDEASTKTSPAKAGQPLRWWVFQDGNPGRLAADINPRSTCFSVQVTLNI